MANTFITTDKVAMEALMLLRSNLVAVNLFDRSYNPTFTGEEKVGDTIRIRRRDLGSVQEFSTTISKATLTETNISLTLEKHFDASFEVTTKDLTLEIQDFSSQILAPRMLAIAEQVDTYALEKLHQLPNVANDVAGVFTLPNTLALLAGVDQKANELLIPMVGRVQVMSPEYNASMLGTASFAEADKRGDSGTALEQAKLGFLMNMNHTMGQNVDSATFTAGLRTSAGTVDGAHAVGATTLSFTGGAPTTTGTMLAGEILDIAGYGGVVTAANSTTFDGSGDGTVLIDEPLREALAGGEVISVTAASASDTYQRHGAVFHPRAFAFVSVPLVVPPEANGSVQIMDGLAIRVVRDYDIDTKKSVMSLDVLVGAKMIEGRLGAQILKDI